MFFPLIYLQMLSGLDKIEFLQNHENQDIYQKAYDIIEQYFGTEEENVQLVPKVDPTTSQYELASIKLPKDGFHF